jgi:hypothetical protein
MRTMTSLFAAAALWLSAASSASAGAGRPRFITAGGTSITRRRPTTLRATPQRRLARYNQDWHRLLELCHHRHARDRRRVHYNV